MGAVRPTTSKQLWTIVLIVAAMAVVWLVVRGAEGGSAGGPGAGRSPSASVQSGDATDPHSGLPWVEATALPPEARDTLDLIAAGGPFPYPRNDNQTFSNREGILPREPRGYYREFTVPTPGEDDRGARRIVTGADGEKYWTDDHYDSFSRIREGT